MPAGSIVIKGARLHNLKNISLEIPKNQLVVFTGLSGSGKSTLAFDLLHREGQRQYMESLGMVTHDASKPQLDHISGLSPSISVDQYLTNRSPRSTVGTSTEVYTYLRVLFARAGHRPCPACGGDVPPNYDLDAAAWDDESPGGEAGDPDYAACPHCGAALPEMGMAMFSFNKPEGACPTCTGLGTVYQANLDRLVDMNKSVRDGAVNGWDIHYIRRHETTFAAAGWHYGFTFDTALPLRDLGQMQLDFLLYGVRSPQFRRHVGDIEPPATVSTGFFEGVATNLIRRHAEHAADPDYLEKIEQFLLLHTCPDCQGTRLRSESRQVRVAGQTIIDVSRMPLHELAAWIAGLRQQLTPEAWQVSQAIVDDLNDRIRRLVEIGIGYLTLDRASPTLSAGEAQRLRLAILLGSGLTGVLYVLDEPTIGLHPRDYRRMLGILRDLRDLGNTVLVIEHDLDIVRGADTVIDFGPGAGRNGGQIVAAGTPEAILDAPESLTAGYLSGRLCIEPPAVRRAPNGKAITIRGARANNLKNITARLPLGLLVAVTGVSGSGKSSLMFDILDRAARRRLYGAADQPGDHDSIEGWEYVDKIVTIDQSPIGRSTRSNAATYTDAFTPIREAFAAAPEARARGLTAQYFSFNVPGGRCERCQGSGMLTVSMHFLPDVLVRCPACRGRRYQRDVLAVKYAGFDIAQVLDMTIAEALPVFQSVGAAASRLALMDEVGLGYLQLGQPATTLSGGEAQRVKLAKELGRRATGRTLYLLDEPTTGLHAADTANLLLLLQRLVNAGSSVIVIEHNLDLIRSADWVIDLGPEGGQAGGQIIAEGPPEEIASHPGSHTGRLLAAHR